MRVVWVKYQESSIPSVHHHGPHLIAPHPPCPTTVPHPLCPTISSLPDRGFVRARTLDGLAVELHQIVDDGEAVVLQKLHGMVGRVERQEPHKVIQRPLRHLGLVRLDDGPERSVAHVAERLRVETIENGNG